MPMEYVQSSTASTENDITFRNVATCILKIILKCIKTSVSIVLTYFYPLSGSNRFLNDFINVINEFSDYKIIHIAPNLSFNENNDFIFLST